MRIKIHDKIYDGAALDQVSLYNWLLFERETKNLGMPLSLGILQAMNEEVQELPEKEQASHPHILWLTAANIWAARLVAGEKLSFEQALDFPLTAMTVIPDPEDHKSPKNPTKRPASKAVAALPVAGSAKTSQTVSSVA